MKAYWWSPVRSARSIGGEIAHHGRAWSYLMRSSRSGPSNFGDAMNPWVLAELTGRKVIWSDIGGADVVCVGSVLNAYVAEKSRATILGAGIRSSDGFDARVVDPNRIVCVRGLETARLLGLAPGKALGDPGLLVKTMYTRKVPRGTTPLLLPHFGALQSASGQDQVKATRAAGFDITFPNEAFYVVAQAIRRASFVATSSLHALVYADAFGVPCQLVNFGSTRTEPEFKYRDYLSIYGRSPSVMSLQTLVVGGLPPVVMERHEQVKGHISRVVDTAIDELYEAAQSAFG